MSLSDGGHLTHGSSVNFSGKTYNAVQYGINSDTGEINYLEIEKLAKQYSPKLLIGGFSAYSRIVDWGRMRDIADTVGSFLLIDMAHVAGLVAAKLYPSPIPHADVVTSTTHKTLRGPRGGIILARENEVLHKKFDSAVFPGGQGGPLMHVIAAKAVSFLEAQSEDFILYQAQVIANARVMAETFIARNFKVVSGGTDNHLLLLDLIGQSFSGKDADELLGRANITVNKNAVPNDPRSPFVTSGLRLGSPAITTRGFKEPQVIQLTNWICDLLDSFTSGQTESTILRVKEQVLHLCKDFPVYKD